MATFTNTSTERRVWPRLVNASTGTTLELAPGDSAPVQHWVAPTDDDGNPIGAPELVDLADADGISFLERGAQSSVAPAPAPVASPPAPKAAPVDTETASVLAACQDTTSTPGLKSGS